MEDLLRPNKRARQACLPCRRKKSRCSGEQPVCSTCARLRQICTYGSEPPSLGASLPSVPVPAVSIGPHEPTSTRRKGEIYRGSPPQRNWQDRLESMENTLSQVVRALGGERASSSLRPPGVSSHADNTGSERTLWSDTTSDSNAVPLSPSLEGGLDAAYLKNSAIAYLKYCECQPLPLFDRHGFINSLDNREPEVVHAIVGAASRFGNDDVDTASPRPKKSAEHFDIAHRLSMARVLNGTVELSTLQALCLLSLYDFDAGRYDRSRLLCSTAASLARSTHLQRQLQRKAPESHEEEQIRCYWAIILLCRIIGEPEPFPSYHRMLHYSHPESPATPSADVMKTPPPDSEGASYGSFGIMEVIIQLSDLWPQVSTYIQTRGGSSDRKVFPWHPSSQYAEAMASLMTLGEKLPLIHRYRSFRISSVLPEHIERARSYWAPWFLSRVMFHGIICILNHPLLLTLQIRGVQNVSEAFLQQTAFALSNHVSWCMHFIDLMASRSFTPSDPWMIYWVAAISTIELFCSISSRTESIKHGDNFHKCIHFIQRFEPRWLYATRTINKLKRLEATITRWSDANRSDGDDDVYLDISSIFEILDTTSLSNEMNTEGTLQRNIFGPILASSDTQQRPSRPEITRLPKIHAIGQDELHYLSPTRSSVISSQMNGQQLLGNASEPSMLEGSIENDFMLSATEFFNGPFQTMSLLEDNSALPDLRFG